MLKYLEVKYQLADHLVLMTMVKPKKNIITDMIELDKKGMLALRRGFACDGPSGPTLDTDDSMRAAFVHDALYQLIGLGYLNTDEDRYYADLTFYNILVEDGMPGFRAWAWYRAVRTFGEEPAKRRARIKYAPSKCD
jgi:hypothetical protein